MIWFLIGIGIVLLAVLVIRLVFFIFEVIIELFFGS